MTKKVSFDAEMQAVESAPRSGWIKFPFGIRTIFGKGRVKVHVVFDYTVEYRGSLVTMAGEDMILVRADVRQALGKNPGDVIHVELWEDKQERVIDLPAEWIAILESNDEIKAAFNRLSYTNRKEITAHIALAKSPETRIRRAERFANNLIKKI